MAHDNSYLKFTGPKRISTAVTTLCGLVEGVLADGTVLPAEMKAFEIWLNRNRDLANKRPFADLFKSVETAISDGQLEKEEIADIRWLCEQTDLANPKRYSLATSDIQFLHGLVGGIAADGVLHHEELSLLSDWLKTSSHLAGTWPYDEFYSLIIQLKKQGRVESRERDIIINYFNDFLNLNGSTSLKMPMNEISQPITGICATTPEIVFEDQTFCLTGKSNKRSRAELATLIHTKKGFFTDNLSKKVDYLLICSDGNPAWTYAAYGRKVEAALKLRKQGHRILLIHETDFWDALQDAA